MGDTYSDGRLQTGAKEPRTPVGWSCPAGEARELMKLGAGGPCATWVFRFARWRGPRLEP